MPRETITTCRTQNRPGCLGRPCAGTCGKRFQRGEPVVVRETPNGWFRGDDTVEFFCRACWAKRKR